MNEVKVSKTSQNGFKTFERVNDVRLLPKTFEVGDELSARLDPRIEQSIAGADAEAFCLHKLASDANLSFGRFRHLFREETNVAFSDYKLWLKVKKAVHYMAEHPDLASAAYGGGFADQAHFSRVSFGLHSKGTSSGGS